MVSLEEFKRLDIKIGVVTSAEKVTEKLIKFIFDVGDHKIQIMAGMAEFFEDTSKLIGKKMPILANIESAKFRGFESNGMIIAADFDNKPVFLIPETDVSPGTKVR